MPKIEFSPEALEDLTRFREFLRPKSSTAAERAGKTIRAQLQVLRDQPHIGRPVPDAPPGLRELVIEFGDTGYVARYFVSDDSVIILRMRHQLELDYTQTSS